MRTKELIQRIDEDGGLNLNMLRRNYTYDVVHCKYKNSFRKWLTGWLKHSYKISSYVAEKVSMHYA